MARKKKATAGQFTLFGKVHEIEKIVTPPEIIEENGQKVIHFEVDDESKKIPGYVEEVKKQARQLLPEARSVEKPPWLDIRWQVKRRKKQEGVYNGF